MNSQVSRRKFLGKTVTAAAVLTVLPNYALGNMLVQLAPHDYKHMLSNNDRVLLINSLFPNNIPDLWCPPIVHYDENGAIDKNRTEAHLSNISQYVKTFLLFGSTGDGWELTDSEKIDLLEIMIHLADKYRFQILLGMLKPDRGASLKGIKEIMAYLQEKFNGINELDSLIQAHVCGFTVCPPKGYNISQVEMLNDLSDILSLNLPTALYQLPQVTENEMDPETVRILAEKYPNFYLFKDTSGNDSVIQSKVDLGGVFTVRGAEGNYDKWVYNSEGGYNGFLLGSANCFAKEIKEVLNYCKMSNYTEAKALSNRIASVVEEVMANVSDIPSGNAFANANKCIDHIRAFGTDWSEFPMPMMHSGNRIPLKYVANALESMKKNSIGIEMGYLKQ